MRRLIGVAGALLVLAAWGQAAPVEDLIGQLRDKDPDVRRAAARALGEAGADARMAGPALITALKDEDLFVRRFAALALGQVGAEPKAAVPALSALLNDRKERKEVQEAAAIALGKLGSGGVEALGGVLKDPNRETAVRKRAAEALGNIGPDARAALDALSDVLAGKIKDKKGGNPEAAANDIRLEVVDALGNIARASDEAILKSLEDIATDKKNRNKALKDAARKAAGKIKARTAIDPAPPRTPEGQAATPAALATNAGRRGRRRAGASAP
jgi:HEAT repeat protein